MPDNAKERAARERAALSSGKRKTQGYFLVEQLVFFHVLGGYQTAELTVSDKHSAMLMIEAVGCTRLPWSGLSAHF